MRKKLSLRTSVNDKQPGLQCAAPVQSIQTTSADIAEKRRGAAKQRKLIETRTEDVEVAEWAQQWAGLFDKSVQYLRLGEAEPQRPEKLWHVLVYGAGHHSELARAH